GVSCRARARFSPTSTASGKPRTPAVVGGPGSLLTLGRECCLLWCEITTAIPKLTSNMASPDHWAFVSVSHETREAEPGLGASPFPPCSECSGGGLPVSSAG